MRDMTGWILFLAAAGVASGWLVPRVRTFALRHHIMDVPNHRSAHQQPIPRGGGLGFVVIFLVSLPLLVAAGALSIPDAIALSGSGLPVALTGYLDDRKGLSPGIRLLLHALACLWGLYWIGGMPHIGFSAWPAPAGMFAALFGFLFLAWFLNLYNFMDGIDGIAATEAITICVSGSVLFFLGGAPLAAVLPLVLAVAVSGFLRWNFPVACIFMGDVGSGFLGVTIGMFTLIAARANPAFFWAWIIFSGVFVVDATYTLMRRVFRLENVFDAHSSHGYQRIARRIGNHRMVTLSVCAINLLWLAPTGLLTGLGYIHPLLGIGIAWIPLLVLVIWAGAGRHETARVVQQE